MEIIGILVSFCYNHRRHKKEIQSKAHPNKNGKVKISQETTDSRKFDTNSQPLKIEINNDDYFSYRL